jgi:hypothetical protein
MLTSSLKCPRPPRLNRVERLPSAQRVLAAGRDFNLDASR